MWGLLCTQHHLALVSALLTTLVTTEAATLECTTPAVEYKDFYISGSHNKTGMWRTTLGKINVIVEHDAKPQMRSMGNGRWEVSVKVSSAGCGDSDIENSGKILEVLSSSEKELSVRDPEERPMNDDTEQERTSTADEIIQEMFSNNFLQPLRKRPSSDDDDDDDDDEGGNVVEQGVLGILTDNVNDVPEEGQVLPSGRRQYAQRWYGKMSEYSDFGATGMIKLFSDSLPWNLAKERCERDGAHLVTVDTQAKVTALLDMFAKNPRVPRTSVLKNQVYVGINDRIQEGVFRTVTGEVFRPWNESVWFTNEPDDVGGDEDCVTFHKAGKIRDVPCRFSLPFFCELDQDTVLSLN